MDPADADDFVAGLATLDNLIAKTTMKESKDRRPSRASVPLLLRRELSGPSPQRWPFGNLVDQTSRPVSARNTCSRGQEQRG
jgi:hypothetical protein